MTIDIATIAELSISERIQLVQEIWDSLLLAPESINVTDAQIQEIERRLENYHHVPESSIPWNEVKSGVK